MTKIHGHYINGAFVQDEGRTQAVYNPALGEVSSQLALASKETVEEAIAAAKAAFPAWRNTPPRKRAQVMFRFKMLLEEHADEICALITAEHGKVLDDARGELQRGSISLFEFGLSGAGWSHPPAPVNCTYRTYLHAVQQRLIRPVRRWFRPWH